jgi:hypothetical protein
VAGLAGWRQSRQEIVMNTTSPQHRTGSQPRTGPAILARKAAFRTRRAVGLVIAATVSLLSLGAGAPAFAMAVAPGGGAAAGSVLATPTVQVISVGLATWQVALIAAGAALLGAAVVLLARRLRPAHRSVTAPAA